MKQGKHEGLGNADSRMHRRTNFDDQNKKIIKSKNSSTPGNFFFDYFNEYSLLQRKKHTIVSMQNSYVSTERYHKKRNFHLLFL